jgi:hypothetical protein
VVSAAPEPATQAEALDLLPDPTVDEASPAPEVLQPSIDPDPDPDPEAAPVVPLSVGEEFGGVWRGEVRGVDAVLELRLADNGSVFGHVRLTEGLKVTDAELIGTWARDGVGVKLDLQNEGDKAARYVGVLSGDLGSGQVIERGKTRGTWSIRQ